MARSIFEDVSGDKTDIVAPKPKRKSARRAIALWLMVLFVLVVFTHVTSEAFLDVRAIGAVWLVGMLWFLLRKSVPAGWLFRLGLIGILSAMLSGAGWLDVDTLRYKTAVIFMVNMGLIGLLAHSIMEMWQEASALLQARRRREQGLMRLGTVLIGLLFVQIVYSALLAGFPDGTLAKTWPDISGSFFPAASFEMQPAWRNFIDSPLMLEFSHRILAYGALLLGGFAWWRSRKSAVSSVKNKFSWLIIAFFGQVVLGILTTMYDTGTYGNLAHSLGAVTIFVVAIWAQFGVAYPSEQKVSRG